MIHITHVIIGLGVGGAELMLKRLISSLNLSKECQHTIVTLTDKGKLGAGLERDGITIKPLNMGGILSIPQTFMRLRRELKNSNPDVVHTWMYHADLLGGLAARSLGIKNIIWGVRTTDVTQGKSNLTILLRRVCALLSRLIPSHIVYVAHAAKSVHEKVGYDRSKSIVIPNGFVLKELREIQSADLDNLRQELNISADDIVIGSLGRFNTVKNQKAFIDMAAEINRLRPDVKFLMVGRGNSWANEKLVEWINKYSLQHCFLLADEQSASNKYLSIMSLFVLHSKTEGFPNALGEAMALGIPCVTFDVGDSVYLIGERGCVSIDNTPNALAVCAMNLLEKNKYDISIYKDYLTNRIEDNFTIDKVSLLYYRLYKGGYS